MADLSFISLCTVAPALVHLTAPGRPLVLLVKPQFEVGRVEAARARGVIRDPSSWAAAVRGVAEALAREGAGAQAVVRSPITGGDGNVEFLLLAEAGSPAADGLEERLNSCRRARGGDGATDGLRAARRPPAPPRGPPAGARRARLAGLGRPPGAPAAGGRDGAGARRSRGRRHRGRRLRPGAQHRRRRHHAADRRPRGRPRRPRPRDPRRPARLPRRDRAAGLRRRHRGVLRRDASDRGADAPGGRGRRPPRRPAAGRGAERGGAGEDAARAHRPSPGGHRRRVLHDLHGGRADRGHAHRLHRLRALRPGPDRGARATAPSC